MQNWRHHQIVGRSSSHFTRVATIYAHEVGVPYELVVVPDLLSLETENYGGHPALKLPALRVDGALLVGTENRGRSCRTRWPRRPCRGGSGRGWRT